MAVTDYCHSLDCGFIEVYYEKIFHVIEIASSQLTWFFTINFKSAPCNDAEVGEV
jgi:hypothetical protein